jgi:hypothetical protein
MCRGSGDGASQPDKRDGDPEVAPTAPRPFAPGEEAAGEPANSPVESNEVEDVMAEAHNENHPTGAHPEHVDPPWFQELVRRAFEREMRRYQRLGADSEESLERAMWYVFDLRNNLTELYQAGASGAEEL